jgi:hypothetical protein
MRDVSRLIMPVMAWITEDDPNREDELSGSRLHKLTQIILTGLAAERAEQELSAAEMQKRLGIGPDRWRYLRDRLDEPPYIELGLDYLAIVAEAESIRVRTREAAILALWRTACQASRSFRTVVRRNNAVPHLMASQFAMGLLAESELPSWIAEIDRRPVKSWRRSLSAADRATGTQPEKLPEISHGAISAHGT